MTNFTNVTRYEQFSTPASECLLSFACSLHFTLEDRFVIGRLQVLLSIRCLIVLQYYPAVYVVAASNQATPLSILKMTCSFLIL